MILEFKIRTTKSESARHNIRINHITPLFCWFDCNVDTNVDVSNIWYFLNDICRISPILKMTTFLEYFHSNSGNVNEFIKCMLIPHLRIIWDTDFGLTGQIFDFFIAVLTYLDNSRASYYCYFWIMVGNIWDFMQTV